MTDLGRDLPNLVGQVRRRQWQGRVIVSLQHLEPLAMSWFIGRPRTHRGALATVNGRRGGAIVRVLMDGEVHG